ncbi:unnamed protein product [Rotaria sordida]|uniref:F-box domain-containing protein n=1 Tax=Rotaria sordida TaxID=392033 RepID=A0A815H119_9BILA|nr:unnamed protein product [Rotaria sordida]CAF1350773.1 unnamed protein product [Rotaria sordida]CAF3877176.1 unnamed protein product [Rotaria sordida]CAF3897743.1 unnamed protein product [Rotaria sordida]
MEHSYIQITDLPDELLIMIFKKLDNIQLLYSLIDVNIRFNKILHVSNLTNRLTLLKWSVDNLISPLSDTVLDRFCKKIIPKIHHNVEWLGTESSSVERILLAAKYPNLNGLALFNMTEDIAQHLFNEENRLIDIFKNQITKLVINISDPKNKYWIEEDKTGQCHIYSFPYTMKYYHNITNNFPGGLFKCVTDLSLFDELPFEHEFFLRISQSFPFMKKLAISNIKAQKKQSNNNNKDSSIIVEYHHLTDLNLVDVNIDYVVQFLGQTKTFLANNLYLTINSYLLRKATHCFTRDNTLSNCAKLNRLHLFGRLKIRQNFNTYFPNVKKIEFSSCYQDNVYIF